MGDDEWYYYGSDIGGAEACQRTSILLRYAGAVLIKPTYEADALRGFGPGRACRISVWRCAPVKKDSEERACPVWLF